MIAKEYAHADLDTAIFYMDMRTYGKDFEQYYNRARDEHGVRFIRSRVHSIDPEGECDLRVSYVDESGEKKSEVFDLVVLSVGFQVNESIKQLARHLGIELNQHNFARTDPFMPMATSRPGVYVCETFQCPKDIPQSVMEALAAASAGSAALGEARWTRTRSKEVPPERAVSEEEPRLGVFVCNCGINIGGIVDVPAVREYARTLPNVVHVEDNLYTCSQDTQVKISRVIKEHHLNRVVVAACTPLTHEPMFRETLIDVGLNKYLFEMANIRNQDSWVHLKLPEKATAKAKDLVRMAVARALLLKPLVEKPLDITPRAVVIGGGIAGMTAALNLAEQGFETIIIEKEKELGGNARHLGRTIEGLDVQKFLNRLIEKIQNHKKIQVLTQALVVGFSGYKGNFTTEVLVGPGMYERKIDHGATIVATGAREYRPQGFLYGEHERVMTLMELGQKISQRYEVAKWNRVVMIQCVGSRQPDNPYCSRICCTQAITNALRFMELNPEANPLKLQMMKCLKKIRAGTDFLITLDAYDLKKLEAFVAQIRPEAVKLLIGVRLLGKSDLERQGSDVTAAVDGVVLATGYVPFVPQEKAQFNFDAYPNMITGLELERRLRDQGGGFRPSDGQPARHIAFVQCVGSRDLSLNHNFCSRVCCGYALRLGLRLSHAQPDTRVSIFYMDLQNFGKDYNRYLREANDRLRLIRSMPGDYFPAPQDQISVHYFDPEQRTVISENFDLVVLSVGLLPRPENPVLGKMLGLELDEHGFRVNDRIGAPRGVVVAGTAEGPMDIAESITHAARAASQLARHLGVLP